MDEFSEKFQTAFDTPPLVFGNHVANFSETSEKTYLTVQNLQRGLKMTPPPFQLFRKFICFGGVTPTLPSYGNKFSINITSRLTKPIAPLQELVWIYFERAQHFDKCLNTA